MEEVEVIEWEEISVSEFRYAKPIRGGVDMYYATYYDFNNTGYIIHPKFFRVNRKYVLEFLALYPNSLMPLLKSNGEVDMNSIPDYIHIDDDYKFNRTFRQIYR